MTTLLARVVGELLTVIARVTHHSVETRRGVSDARALVFGSLLASSDEPSLVGVEGKGRGHTPMSPAVPAVALAFWRRCAGHWAFAELTRRRDLTLDNCSPVRSEPNRFARNVRR